MERIRQFESRQNGVMSAKVMRRTHQCAAIAAESMSRLGLARASAELCNEAVILLINLCYAVDPDVGTPGKHRSEHVPDIDPAAVGIPLQAMGIETYRSGYPAPSHAGAAAGQAAICV